MKRGGEGFGAGGPAKRRPYTAKCCMKVLCPDVMVKALIGPRGATKDQIQNDTGTKLVFSNKEEFYPGTYYRVLGIYADDLPLVVGALRQLIGRVVELGEEERRNPPPNGSEFRGKEAGEYLVRLAISKVTSGEIIGPGGGRIKELRQETETKIFIENETIADHQMVRIIGQPERIEHCLERFGDFLSTTVGSEEHVQWGSLINFSEIENSYDHDLPPRPPPPPPSYERERPPPRRDQAGRDGGKNRSYRQPNDEPRDKSWNDAGDEDANKVVDELGKVIMDIGPEKSRMPYSITFMIASSHVERLKSDTEYISYVKDASGASEINLDLQEPSEDPWELKEVSIVGSLLNIYLAHMLLLKRAHEEEHEEQAEAEENPEEDPATLMAKIQELEAQLAQAQSRKGARNRKS